MEDSNLNNLLETNNNQYKDKLIVRGLKVKSVVGGDHWDRPKLQPITLDITFFTSIVACGKSDILAHSLSYSEIASEATKVAEEDTHQTFVDLGDKLCYHILKKFNGTKVSVRIQKPKGLLHAETSGLEITRVANEVNNDKDQIERLDIGMYAKGDRLFINSLRLSTIIGIHPWEREAKQVVLIHLDLYPYYSNLKANKKPHNYRTLVATLSSIIEESKFKTVEALATSIARITCINCHYPKVTVRVEKPSALRFADAAAAEITRDIEFFEKEIIEEEKTLELIKDSKKEDEIKGNSVLIAFGSNLGDKYNNIVNGLKALEEIGCKLIDTSFLYESKPMYFEDQPRFLNGVCKIKTSLSPIELLDELKKIEEKLGRTPTIRNGPRLIDLDILSYENVECDTERLVLPHPRIVEREFVLRPLNDISPDWEHPKLHKTAKQLLSRLMHNQKESELVKVLPWGNNQFWVWGERTYVMGILNVTTDSFSDGGDYVQVDKAVNKAKEMIDQGADIIDIGGASTRPGAEEVSIEEEINRVIPVILKLREQGIKCLISVDTFNSEVANKAIEAGANFINDVSGGSRDPKMFSIMAKHNVPVCLMHMRGDSKTMSTLNDYGTSSEGQIMSVVQNELSPLIKHAITTGVYRWNILLDPGIGFAKNTEQNLQLIRALPLLASTSFPTLFGASRKRFIGEITGKDPKLRGWGTAATCTAAIQGGCDVLRVHDVEEMNDVIKVSDAVYRGVKL